MKDQICIQKRYLLAFLILISTVLVGALIAASSYFVGSRKMTSQSKADVPTFCDSSATCVVNGPKDQCGSVNPGQCNIPAGGTIGTCGCTRITPTTNPSASSADMDAIAIDPAALPPNPTTSPASAMADSTGFSPATSCKSFTDRFYGNTLHSGYWQQTFGSSGYYALRDNHLMLFLLPKSDRIYIESKNIISGDFASEVTIDPVSSVGLIDDTNKANYNFDFCDAAYKMCFAVGRSSTGKIIVFYSNNPNKVSDWHTSVTVTQNNSSSIKAKLERKGATSNVYLDLNDGVGYKLVKSYPNSYKGEGKIIHLLGSYGAKSGTALLSNFSQTCPLGGM